MNQNAKVSIILPCYNEAENLEKLLPRLKAIRPDDEIIVVDDGSSDNSSEIAHKHNVKTVRHPTNIGNGASIKTGSIHASGDILLFMDSDGQHAPEDIERLLDMIDKGFDMVVGARTASTHASLGRRFANCLYNRLASVMTGYRIDDLTSGFRAVRANKFRRFLYLLPNGFSYPTTSTMAFFRSGYPVAYVPIQAAKRMGKSKISALKDGTRFFLIIVKIGTLFSPMRFFLPISILFFCLGLGHYINTYLSEGRFTNMSALLFITSLITFMIGIISEQISSLHYKNTSDSQQDRISRDPP